MLAALRKPDQAAGQTGGRASFCASQAGQSNELQQRKWPLSLCVLLRAHLFSSFLACLCRLGRALALAWRLFQPLARLPNRLPACLPARWLAGWLACSNSPTVAACVCVCVCVSLLGQANVRISLPPLSPLLARSLGRPAGVDLARLLSCKRLLRAQSSESTQKGQRAALE